MLGQLALPLDAPQEQLGDLAAPGFDGQFFRSSARHGVCAQ
jgi:hypothetical protein